MNHLSVSEQTRSKKLNTVLAVLENKATTPENKMGRAFAPSNIALCKYWGKRNSHLNLPLTSSVSVSLNTKGTQTGICLSKESSDQFIINNELQPSDSPLSIRLRAFLDLFRFSKERYYNVESKNNIPISAGLASSASGFAAMVKALDNLYGWNLDNKSLSILARLGSGSAARSIETGFVQWYQGNKIDGLDSFAEKLDHTWPELRIGLCLVSRQAKPISSTLAMEQTVNTSHLYNEWLSLAKRDLGMIKQAIVDKQWEQFGKTVESNAIAMHACMHTSWPPIYYDLPESLALKHKIWTLREQGIPIYFTQDAGPNIKCLFLEDCEEEIQFNFADMDIVRPFYHHNL